MTTTLNIGLNNNPQSFEQVTELMTKIFNADGEWKVESQLRAGVYSPDEETTIIEPTAVIRITDNIGFNSFFWNHITELFCQKFTQECIPYQSTEGGRVVAEKLVYADSFKGERYKFDANYFLQFVETN
jgi:hypothetical protein